MSDLITEPLPSALQRIASNINSDVLPEDAAMEVASLNDFGNISSACRLLAELEGVRLPRETQAQIDELRDLMAKYDAEVAADAVNGPGEALVALRESMANYVEDGDAVVAAVDGGGIGEVLKAFEAWESDNYVPPWLTDQVERLRAVPTQPDTGADVIERGES